MGKYPDMNSRESVILKAEVQYRQRLLNLSYIIVQCKKYLVCSQRAYNMKVFQHYCHAGLWSGISCLC